MYISAPATSDERRQDSVDLSRHKTITRQANNDRAGPAVCQGQIFNDLPDLGILIDSQLSIAAHVATLSQVSFPAMQTRLLQSLTMESAKTLLHTLVSSHLAIVCCTALVTSCYISYTDSRAVQYRCNLVGELSDNVTKATAYF